MLEYENKFLKENGMLPEQVVAENKELHRQLREYRTFVNNIDDYFEYRSDAKYGTDWTLVTGELDELCERLGVDSTE